VPGDRLNLRIAFRHLSGEGKAEYVQNCIATDQDNLASNRQSRSSGCLANAHILAHSRGGRALDTAPSGNKTQFYQATVVGSRWP
jgi:hypothetical protein